MKKAIILSVLCMVEIAAMGQVSRIGNKYHEGDSVMNERAFMGYLQSRDAVSYDVFRKGQQMTDAGWSLFAGSFALSAVGHTMVFLFKDEYAISGIMLISVGTASLGTSIACLSIGYTQKHSAVDYYNGVVRRGSPAVTLGVQTSGDGIGLALAF